VCAEFFDLFAQALTPKAGRCQNGSVFGRLEEIDSVLDLVRQGRLVTVVGPGGVGKSTLVEAVSDSLETSQLAARLEGLGSEGLEESLAGELGFPSWRDLVGHLTHRSIVLILDNCEHVLEPLAPIVADLMDGFDSLTVLATSREPLGLTAEKIFRVEPFSVAGSPSPASLLFVDFVQSRGLPISDDWEDIEALCSSLDGLPLALELAAGRMSSMTAKEIRASVETRLDLLSRSRPTTGRDTSLDAAIQWSVDLLDQRLADFFRPLSMLEGQFDLQLAAAAGGLRYPDAVLMLHELIEKSLVVHEAAAGVSWYRMLNTVRTLCRDRLTNAEKDAVQERIVDRLAERWSGLSRPEAHMGDLLIIDEVRHHFRAVKSAILWCLNHDSEPRRVRNMITPLLWLEEIGNHAEAADLLSRVELEWPHDRELVSIARSIRANFLQLAGATTEATDLAAEALEASEPFSNWAGHRVLGIVERRLAHYDEALAHFRSGSEAARSSGWDAHGIELEAHGALALYASGDHESALRLLADLESRSRPYPLCRRTVELFHASLLVHAKPAEAELRAGPILEQAHLLGHTWAEGTSAYLMAAAAVLQGNAARGAMLLADAIEAYEQSRNTAELQRALIVGSGLLDQLGDRRSAAEARVAAGRLPGEPVGDPVVEISMVGVDIDELARVGGNGEIGLIAAALRRAADRKSSVTGLADAQGSANSFVSLGDYWEVDYLGVRSLIKHTKGMGDLRYLLSQPGREVSALDLMNADVVDGDTGPVLDRQARAEYEQRIRDLQEQIDEAQTSNDPVRAEMAAHELDELLRQLARAHGLGGRERRGGDTAERARSAVTWRIRAAIDRVSTENPELGEHLTRCIKTGRFCVYLPESEIAWQT
jgi:predicted ATPase/tetratricopeptide (TPR) repeat protein